MCSCFVIAEIGVNHNGSVEIAKNMVDAAKKSGADAVKFQTYKADVLSTKKSPKVKYQESTTNPEESHFEMLRRLELSSSAHEELFSYCRREGIEFMSTPYDSESVKLLDDLGVRVFKTASADIVDILLHIEIAKTNKPCFVSTGMSNLEEIGEIVKIYRERKSPDPTLLHCVSNYPCKKGSLNLNALHTLSSAFNVNVGFSDHSEGFLASSLAVALGAKVIEKHFTLDRSMKGPDHRASAEPSEFAELVRKIRESEEILGSHIKRCMEEEKQMRLVSRKSIVARRNIRKGETILGDSLTLKRPGNGLYACDLGEVMGKKAKADIEQNEIIQWSNIE